MTRNRPKVAFFEYADVFEDFYPHFGVDQRAFTTEWRGTSNHALLALIQREIGDVTWYSLALRSDVPEATHHSGFRVRIIRSSIVHRLLWNLFYARRWSWRVRRYQRAYSTLASYLAPLTLSLRRALVRDGCDLILVQDYSSGRFDVVLALARSMHVPIIAYHAGSTDDQFVGRTIRRLTLKRADRLLVSSHSEGAYLSKTFSVPEEICRVVLTPIDTETFAPRDRAASLEAAGLAGGRRYFLFVGRLDDGVKQVSTLIRAFGAAARDHRDAVLLIVGAGPDSEHLRAYAAELLGTRVIFRDWVNDVDELSSLYNAAEALVLASLREGFPAVVGEAMACGTPVIATDVGGVGELVVEGHTGMLVRPGDEPGLRRALADAMKDPARLHGLRAEARATALKRVAPAVVEAALHEEFDRAMQRGRG